MKYTVFAALASVTNAADPTVGTACTQTWKDMKDAACTGDGEQCFDWLSEDGKTSNGLKCGLTADCTKDSFKYTDPKTSTETTYKAMCSGLSGTACTSGSAECDTVGGFACADWFAAGEAEDSKVPVMGCASKAECTAGTANGQTLVCSGVLGDACKNNSECDTTAGYKCGMEFNNATMSFVADAKAMCAKSDSCNKAMGNGTSVTLCYDTPDVACGGTNATACSDSVNTTGEVSCGYLAPGNTTNLTSGGMCVDKKLCDGDALTTVGKNITYFGTPTTLWCGSARTALAMGAAAISAYLAM